MKEGQCLRVLLDDEQSRTRHQVGPVNPGYDEGQKVANRAPYGRQPNNQSQENIDEEQAEDEGEEEVVSLADNGDVEAGSEDNNHQDGARENTE